MAYGLEMPDIVGKYTKGMEMGRAAEKERREQPYLAKMKGLQMQRQEQALKVGKKQMTLQDLSIRETEKQAERDNLKDIGQAAKWADTPEKFEQALDFYEQSGADISAYRGRFDLRDQMIGFSDPDYAKQQKALENVRNLVQQYPEDQRAAAESIAAVSQSALVKDAADRLLDAKSGEGDIEDVVATLPAEHQATAKALLEFDPKEGVKLVRDIAKAKVEKKAKASVAQQKIAMYATRMVTADVKLKEIEDAGYEPGGMWDSIATGTTWGNWLVSPEGQMYRQAQNDWARAKLRQESGAVISEEEIENEVKTYFPIPGGSDEVNQQKAERRKIAEQGMIDASGSAYKGGGVGGNEDQEALAWAKANPGDPRSAQILDKLKQANNAI